MFAHLYRAKGGGWCLYISDNLDCFQPLFAIAVSGKREARKLAMRYSAKCWNF